MAWPNTCEVDGKKFESSKPWAKYCSDRCRNAAARDRKRAAAKEIGDHERQLGATVGQLEQRTRAELVKVKREDTVLGEAVLMMARAIDSGMDQPLHAIARGLSEHRAALLAATDGAKAATEDELALLRKKKERNARRRGAAAR